MTPQCIQEVIDLERDSQEFADLTLEQLLFAAIKGSDPDEVVDILTNTDWMAWISYSNRTIH